MNSALCALLLFFAASALPGVEFPALKVVEELAVQRTPQLRSHVATIGRVGLLTKRPAILLDDRGHLLGPMIAAIDGTPAPYLLFRMDGSRVPLEIVEENEKRGLVLLRLAAGVPERMKPAMLASGPGKGRWFQFPMVSPEPRVGEPVSFPTGRRTRPEDEDEPLEDAGMLEIDAVPVLGSPIFDMAGELCAISVRRGENSTIAMPLSRVQESWKPLRELLPQELGPSTYGTNLPKEKAWSQSLREVLPSPAPYGLVINQGKSLSYSLLGTVIREDGLILTKASDLGPSLSFRIGETTHPAVLLATDEETDLALLSVEASGLPVIDWVQAIDLRPGSLLVAPVLLSPDPQNQAFVVSGSFSHSLTSSSPRLEASAEVTSLGLIPEQAETSLRVAAVVPGSSAEKAGIAPGAVVISFAGKPVSTRPALVRLLAEHSVGELVKIGIETEGETITHNIELGPARPLPPATGIDLRGPLTTVPSVRRGPFPDHLVHDLYLNAWDVGGPLFDSAGKAVAFNVAAVGDHRGFALDPATVRAAVDRMLARPLSH